jgi:hypothetical protein
MALPANSWLQYITSRNEPYVYVAFGDSYPGGSGGVSFADDLRSQTSQVVINIAVGGTNFTQQLAQVQAVIGYLNGSRVRWVWWNGSLDGNSDPAQNLAGLDAILAVTGSSNFSALNGLALGPPSGSSAQYLINCQDIYAGFAPRGVKTTDIQTYLVTLNDPADASSTAAGLVGPASTQDGTHLTSGIMDSAAARYVSEVVPQF